MDGPKHDQELIDRVVAGDLEAFEALYDRHADVVFRYLVRVMGDRQIAENLLQEAFVRAWRHAPTYRAERGQVRSWLFGIAHHVALHELRSQRRRPQGIQLAGDRDAQAAVERVREPAPGPAEAAWAAVRRADLVRALDQLPPNQRQVIELYAIGYTQSEIATSTDHPLGTVKTWMRRGLLHLRETLEREGFDAT
ncbi:MAG: sigma-70 family RNA polymerase sigma factor [Chloroflexia bacterium]|nr:sigma-70 family RNA polymerase sigma factor [Chloroflexia bacterium]